MGPQFAPYDIVRVKDRRDIASAVVLDYTYRRPEAGLDEPRPVYTLYIEPGRLLEAPESNLEKVGRLEPPLQPYEIVEVRPRARRYARLTGNRGVVEGFSWNHETGEWGFAVSLKDGDVWFFMENELTGTGQVLPPGSASIPQTDDQLSPIAESDAEP